MQSKWLFAATPKSADSLISRFSQMFSSSWLSALFAGMPYNREKTKSLVYNPTPPPAYIPLCYTPPLNM